MKDLILPLIERHLCVRAAAHFSRAPPACLFREQPRPEFRFDERPVNGDL
jgi:hypothetical protein